MKYVLALCGLLLLNVNVTVARQLEVCIQCAFSTVTSAVASAADCDTIRVHPGTYAEGNIRITKSLYLLGIGKPMLDGRGETEILTVEADQVTIDGFQIQRVGTSFLEDRAGIRIRNSKYFTIKNNTLLDTFFGIYLEHASDGSVLNNEIIGEAEQEMSSGNAIHLWYCKRVRVEQNMVAHHRDGIYLEFVDQSLIQHNRSAHNLRYGLHFMFSNDNAYLHNQFRDNGAGVAVMFSKRIHMRYNDFVHNWGKAAYGLLLKEIYDADIQYNRFTENTIGIFVEGSARIIYAQNDFRRNGWAVKMSGGCVDNVMHTNNFVGNTFNLSVNSPPNNNTFNGNHWSDYAGYDLDRDGVGDVPHRPVKLFNYIVQQTPEATVLLRSLFVDLINFSERVSPLFTPKNVLDHQPLLREITFPTKQ